MSTMNNMLTSPVLKDFNASHSTNKQEYQEQLNYLQTLNENQYKWTVKGLEAAGLNPILAVNGGAHSATTAGNIGNYNNNSATAINSVNNILQTILNYAMLKKLK